MPNKQNEIKTFSVNLTYYKKAYSPKGELIEECVENAPVEIGCLSRLSASHSNFIVSVLDAKTFKDNFEIAGEYARLMIVDDNLRKDICVDKWACLQLYTSQEVQADVERFLSLLGFGKAEAEPNE